MIKVEVFFLSDRQWRNLAESEDDFENYELFECDLVERYYITIDNFGEYIEPSTKTPCTSFYSGGMEWITPLHINDFIKLLQDATQKSN